VPNPFAILIYTTSAQSVILLLKNFFWKIAWLPVKNIFIKKGVLKGQSGKALKKKLPGNS
jgi:hypothetical protein